MTLRAGPEDRGVRLDVFLARHLLQMTRSHIQTLNRTGAVRIAGRKEKSGYKLKGGEIIDIDFTDRAAPVLEPRDIPLSVVYEDEDLAVIDKPAGMVVHPGSGTTDTVVHALLYRFGNLSRSGGEGRPGIVHRLDKWTSGLLIVAKNDWTHAALSKAFQSRTVEKTYRALVHGRLRRSSGQIDLSIGRHATIRTRMSAQAARGLAGDDVYGERAYAQFSKKYGKLGRYFLHAAELKFTHPRTGQPLHLHSPLPPELNTLLERLRGIAVDH